MKDYEDQTAKRNDQPEIKGEGNPEADAEYRERTREFVEDGKVPAAAREAEDAVNRKPEGKILEEAREKTKQLAEYDV